MNVRELNRALAHKPNGRISRPESVPTMSEAVLGLADLTHIQQISDIAQLKLRKYSHPLFTNSKGNHFNRLEDALSFGNQHTWKLAEYYVDNNGLFLIYLPSSRELTTVALQQLATTPSYVLADDAAQDIYPQDLIERYSLILKVTGDYRLYFDFGDTAEQVEGHITGQCKQSTTIIKTNREHCLRRATYIQDGKTMVLTYYC